MSSAKKLTKKTLYKRLKNLVNKAVNEGFDVTNIEIPRFIGTTRDYMENALIKARKKINRKRRKGERGKRKERYTSKFRSQLKRNIENLIKQYGFIIIQKIKWPMTYEKTEFYIEVERTLEYWIKKFSESNEIEIKSANVTIDYNYFIDEFRKEEIITYNIDEFNNKFVSCVKVVIAWRYILINIIHGGNGLWEQANDFIENSLEGLSQGVDKLDSDYEDELFDIMGVGVSDSVLYLLKSHDPHVLDIIKHNINRFNEDTIKGVVYGLITLIKLYLNPIIELDWDIETIVEALRYISQVSNSLNIIEFSILDEDGVKKKVYVPLRNNIDMVVQSIENRKYSPFYRDSDSYYYEDVADRGILDDIDIETIRNDGILIKTGDFFPYKNTSSYDLARYQIISNKSQLSLLKEHCLVYALKMSLISPDKIDKAKKYISNYTFKLRDIANLSKELEINITLRTIKETDNGYRIRTPYYYKSNTQHPDKIDLDLSLYKGHYFINEDVEIDYDELRKYCKENGIRSPKRNRSKKISSFQLVKVLDDCGLFVKDDELFNIVAEYKISNHQEKSYINLNPNLFKKECVNYTFKHTSTKRSKPQRDIHRDIVFADCESRTKSVVPRYDEQKGKYVLDRINCKHVPYKIGYSHIDWEEDNVKIITDIRDGKSLLNSMLSDLCKTCKSNEIIIYFHNLKYDWTLFDGETRVLNKCVKDGKYYQITLVKSVRKKGADIKEYHTKRKDLIANNASKSKIHQLRKLYYDTKFIKLRDSFKLITCKLSKFQELLGLPARFNKVEAMPYQLYDNRTILRKSQPISKALEYIPDNLKSTFEANIEKFRINGGRFAHMDYMDYYLKYDVNVLKYGMIKFNDLFTQPIGSDEKSLDLLTKLKLDPKLKLLEDEKSIFDFLTIGSISQYCAERFGCYDGVCYLRGNLMNFCQSAIRGGRVCLMNNEKQKVTKKEYNSYIQDYDAVSCYASSMNRLSDELGFPVGVPSIITNPSYNNIKNLPYYIVEIRIKSIKKTQQIPLYSEVREVVEEGKKTSRRRYINEPTINEVDNIQVVDKITLEDWIEHQHITFDVLQGIYWDKFNKKIGTFIKLLFGKRLIAKSQKNEPLSTLLKLIMNSIYGKTLTKQSNERKVYINGDKLNDYVLRNYRCIKSYECILGDSKDRTRKSQFEVNVNKIDFKYKNRCHIGGLVLSYSKRIMNEVICLANDLNIPIFYTDTDSMHLLENDIPKLEEEFYKKYNRKIGGKELGQFHVDFEIYECRNVKCSNVKSKYFCVPGPKTYYDRLIGTKSDGSIMEKDHIKMKGVRDCALVDKQKKYSITKIYDMLYDGKVVEFDNSADVFTPMFEFKDRSVVTHNVGSCKKKIQFN